MVKTINALYRAKTGNGRVDAKYRSNKEVKFIKYLGKSLRGLCRIKYELINFKGEVVGKNNVFKTCDIDWHTVYTITRV